MRPEIRQIYAFESFRLDLAERQLVRDGELVRLTPKAFDVLAVLVEQSGHLIEKEELMARVWPDSIVEESNISRIIHTLRNALGENETGGKLIETVAKKGYRFIGEVIAVTETDPSVPARLSFTADVAGLSRSVDDPVHETQVPIPGRRRWVFLSVIAALCLAAGGFAFMNKDRITASRTNSLAQQHYERGRFAIEKGSEGGSQALESFEKAIELDPNFAGAYAGKADARTWMFWGPAHHDDDMIQARTAVEKALELDASNSYAHTILCRIKGTYDYDFTAAERECLRAIELDPNDHQAHREMAFFYNVVGREDDALREIETTISISGIPFDTRSRGLILYYSRRYDEAIQVLRDVEERYPGQTDATKWLACAYEKKQDYDNALEAQVRHMERMKASPEEIAAVRAAYAEGGWPAVLRTIIAGSKQPSYTTAAAYAQLGEKDKALELLNGLFERHVMMLMLCAREPRFDPLRSDPRFDDLVRRIGLR